MKLGKGDNLIKVFAYHLLATLLAVLLIRLPYVNWFLRWEVALLFVVNWVLVLHFYQLRESNLFQVFWFTLTLMFVAKAINIDVEWIGIALLIELLSTLLLKAKSYVKE